MLFVLVILSDFTDLLKSNGGFNIFWLNPELVSITVQVSVSIDKYKDMPAADSLNAEIKAVILLQ